MLIPDSKVDEGKKQMKAQKKERPTKDQMYLDMAEAVAMRSTCLRRNYGALIVNEDEVISFGYGDAPQGTPSCFEIGSCYRDRMGAKRGEQLELCRAVHAEQSAIIRAGRQRTLGSTLYLVGLDAHTKVRVLDALPCPICRRVIINAGIRSVVVGMGWSESRSYRVETWIEEEGQIAVPSSSRKSLFPRPRPLLDASHGDPETLKQRLKGLKAGNQEAREYQKLVLEILDFLFNPELVDGKMEVKTLDGTERRDMIFSIDSDYSFWTYLMSHHSTPVIMFETKNTIEVDNIHLNQIATYLGKRIGTLGFIVTRNPLQQAQQRKVNSIYNDSEKIILALSDSDLVAMLDMKSHGENPTQYIRKLYRSFLTSVQ